MKILIALFLAFGALFAKVSVSVSIIPQAYFVEKIAGDLASVNIMVQKGKSPETYEPSVKELQNLSKSQLYFNIGMPFERAWVKRFLGVNPKMKIIQPLKDGELEKYNADSAISTNICHSERSEESQKKIQNRDSSPKAQNDKIGVDNDSLENCNAESSLDSATHAHENHAHDSHKGHENHAHHDEHEHDSHEHNHAHLPHIWLSFILSQAHARQISDALCEVDSANCATYEANLEILLKEISDLHAHFKGVFKGKGGAFLVYHPAFSYLANELGLREFSIEVDGKDAKIAHTREIFVIIKKHKIKSIFIQPQFSSKNAKIIAKEASLEIKTADPLAKNWSENIAEFLREVAKDNE